MRDIKFRGKRVDNGEWVYGWLIKWPPDKYIIIPFDYIENDRHAYVGTNYDVEPPHIFEISSDCTEVITKTVEQFTGLKDKNGKEIYGGDIIQGTNGKKFIVYWSDRDIAFKIKTFPQIWLGQKWEQRGDYYFGEYNRFIKYTDGTTLWDKLEVIGNIHENSELLNP